MTQKRKTCSHNILQEKIWIYGKHAVLSALENPNRIIKIVYLLEKEDKLKDNVKKYINKKNKNILLKIVTRNFIKKKFSTIIKHQGIIAEAVRIKYEDCLNVINNLERKNNSLGIILDKITDPNNVGAIYRSAYAFNTDFIISEKKNAPNESNTILNSACGAFDKISTFKTANLNQAIQTFKNNGWWVIGLDHNSKLKINDFFKNFSSHRKILLVLGSEGKGIRRLVKENCDYLVSIETVDQEISINVSNATSIFLHEIYNYLSK
tara:strand:- start:1021 stop:1815 length:795 start_codon:yes stop_codon:yes gene_type:complete